jgi:hypothetical protein
VVAEVALALAKVQAECVSWGTKEIVVVELAANLKEMIYELWKRMRDVLHTTEIRCLGVERELRLLKYGG